MRGIVLAACALVLAAAAHASEPDADVPRFAHIDAGDPAPFTGDELNTAAERHLLAACAVDGGAPPVVEEPSACGSLVVPVVGALAGLLAGAWVHQRVTH